MRAWRGSLTPPASFSSPATSSFRLLTPSIRALLLAGLLAALWVAGCAKKAPSKSELRGVTSEIVASVQKITAHKSEITIRPELRPAAGNAAAQGTVDLIYVSLTDPRETQTLEKSVGDIARRHRLSLTKKASAGVVVLDIFFRSTRTHSLHIVTPVAWQPRGSNSSSTGPRLAIILDDLGYDRAAADSLLELPFPLTVSVIPHLPLSSEVAEEAFRRGDQVLLHLPMQSESSGEKGEEVELQVGMNSQQVASTLGGMLETVPHAVGVNNHQGSLATADPTLMRELMPALRQRGLFFIDSRTTTATVAYNVAEAAGVRAASRRVFLDDSPTKESIRSQLDLAARDAKRDGFAIAIGHPHPATIAALAEEVPQLESRGIRFVFASDVVR